MTQIQVYKKNVSLAEKKAHIQQQASMQSNDIDLENLDALEAFIDKFVDMCNNKAKLVCKYSPEELRNKLIQDKWMSRAILHAKEVDNWNYAAIDAKYFNNQGAKCDTYPNLQYFIDNFNMIVNNMADPKNNCTYQYKHYYLHKTKFDKYDLIDFDNLHILTDASLENFITQECNEITDIKEISKILFAKTDKKKITNNETKYNMLKSIYANSTYHKLEEFKERVAERKGDVIEWKCGWVKEMDYAVFLKLYKTLYKEFNLNTMESLVKQTTINMKCLEENLRYIVMFACGKNV